MRVESLCHAALAALAFSACSGGVQEGLSPVPGCATDSQCPQEFFCVRGACQLAPATCAVTSDCTGTDVCRFGHCSAGCATLGCNDGLVCDPGTRVCVPRAPDGGTPDAGAPDAGLSDAGAPDAGPSDAGSGAGPPDGGSGTPDAGVAGTALTNGDFESGTLAGWSTSGQTSVAADAHSGAHSAMVGSLAPSNSSAISQSMTLPAGSPQLSFWFKVVCPDQVQYDYASAAALGADGTVLAVALPATCTNDGVWVHGAVDLSAFAGQPATLLFGNHDDQSPGDATYTLYDDIQIVQATHTGPDFSLTARPSSVTGAGSAVIGASGSGGFASSITLSASGAPAGATASLSVTSVSAGGSANLSLSPGTAAAGSYTISVTGSGGGVQRGTSVSWTIPGAGPSPDFSLSASPSVVSGAGSSSIAVAPQNGFGGAVSLSIAGAPAGSTASLSTSTVGGGSGSATLSLTPGSGAAGTYTVTVTGTSGSLRHAATISWTLAAAACTADTWGNYASSAFSNNCAYCHGWANSYSSVNSKASSCQTRISNGNMPQDHALSADDRSRLVKWLSCGLPQ